MFSVTSLVHCKEANVHQSLFSGQGAALFYGQQREAEKKAKIAARGRTGRVPTLGIFLATAGTCGVVRSTMVLIDRGGELGGGLEFPPRFFLVFPPSIFWLRWLPNSTPNARLQQWQDKWERLFSTSRGGKNLSAGADSGNLAVPTLWLRYLLVAPRFNSQLLYIAHFRTIQRQLCSYQATY
jgi:hypothetical protein